MSVVILASTLFMCVVKFGRFGLVCAFYWLFVEVLLLKTCTRSVRVFNGIGFIFIMSCVVGCLFIVIMVWFVIVKWMLLIL